MANKYYKNYDTSKRKALKEKILRLKELIQEKEKYYQETFIKPQKRMLQAIDDMLKNKIPIEHFNKIMDYNKNYEDRWLRIMRKGVKK